MRAAAETASPPVPDITGGRTGSSGDAAAGGGPPPVGIMPVGLCLDCDYPLHDLPDRRCPECGRAFDPAVRPSVNRGPPLGPWRRLILRPVGWPTFAAAGVPLAGMWWLGTDPRAYGMGLQYVLGLFTLTPVGFVQLVRAAPKRALEQRLGLPPRDFRRWCAFWLVAAAAVLGVFFYVPLRLALLASRPALDRAAATLLANPAALGPAGRVGLYSIARCEDHGSPEHPNLLIFTSHDSGFRYCPGDPHFYGWGGGDEGHLWGPWYWFASD